MACTIELTNFEEEYDCAVIDEVQLMQDPQRGDFWTSALFGIKAKEIHLCGSEVAFEKIVEILK